MTVDRQHLKPIVRRLPKLVLYAVLIGGLPVIIVFGAVAGAIAGVAENVLIWLQELRYLWSIED